VSLVRPLEGRFWRILSPRWAHEPLSGEGAARHGGRWNPPGKAALYLSMEVETAFAEYQQELGTRPGLFVAYDVTGARVADLREARALRQAGLEAGDAFAPWKDIAWVRKQRPATWDVMERLEGKADGLLAPSAQRLGGFNLVLWRWNAGGGPNVAFHDPKNDLHP
jgi:RES domain-containing protein